MSARYVWDRFNISVEKTESISSVLIYATDISINSTYCAVLATNCQYNAQMGYYELGGQISWINSNSFPQNAADYPYLAFLYSDTVNKEPLAGIVFHNSNQNASDEDLYWSLKKGTISEGAFHVELELVPQSHMNDPNSHLYHKTFTKYEVVEEESKGSVSKGRVSSSRSAEYPHNGTYNGLWHEYLGSDSIDPQGVSAELASSGGSATVRITPARAVYGGVISYQYQSRVNQEAWKDLGGKTTAASVFFPVPAGAEALQFRAVASDGWGFASKTYVYSAVVTVNRIECYVRINGAARKVEMIFIPINGRIRAVTEAYARVGGTVKKLF